jgi:hypothetical protein
MPSESVNANPQHFKNLAVVQLCEITRIRYMRYVNSMTLKILDSVQQRKTYSRSCNDRAFMRISAT